MPAHIRVVLIDIKTSAADGLRLAHAITRSMAACSLVLTSTLIIPTEDKLPENSGL
jgi:hypothetical protein